MSHQEVPRGHHEHPPLSSLSAGFEFDRRKFDNPALEWRRLFAEVLGTFFVVLVGAGGGTVNTVSHGQISWTAAVTAPGLMVLAVILFMGAISEAHLNPAVSLALRCVGVFRGGACQATSSPGWSGPRSHAFFYRPCLARQGCSARRSQVLVSTTGRRWLWRVS